MQTVFPVYCETPYYVVPPFESLLFLPNMLLALLSRSALPAGLAAASAILTSDYPKTDSVRSPAQASGDPAAWPRTVYTVFSASPDTSGSAGTYSSK